MDSFVIIKKQKKSYELSLRDNEINNLKRCLDEGKNVFLCGTAGCGKTFILKNVLDETNSVERYIFRHDQKIKYVRIYRRLRFRLTYI